MIHLVIEVSPSIFFGYPAMASRVRFASTQQFGAVEFNQATLSMYCRDAPTQIDGRDSGVICHWRIIHRYITLARYFGRGY